MTTVLLPSGGTFAPPAGTLDWPDVAALRPASMTIGVRPTRSAWQAAYTRQRTAVSHLGDRLAVTLRFAPVVDAASRGVREAFAAQLLASNPLVRMMHFGRQVPAGTLRGTVTLASDAAAGALSIALTGATAGSNMLYGGGMEGDANSDGLADYWAAYSSGSTGTVTYSRAAGNGSTYSQRVDATALGTTSSDQAGIGHTVHVPVVAGATYTLAADTRDAGSPVRLHVDWYTAGDVLISATTEEFAASGASWARRELAGAAPATAAYARLYVWTQRRPSAAGVAALEVDNVQFEPGAAATAYAGVPTLAGGDLLGIGNTLAMVRYAGATGVDGGQITVPLALPLRVAGTAGDAVTWLRPTGVFQVEQVADLSYLAGLVQDGFELSLLEVA